MVHMARLERRHFEGTVEGWLGDEPTWRPSPDVTCGWDARARDRVYALYASAASALITWLRRQGRGYTATEVQWRFEHGGPVPPSTSGTSTGTVAVLPDQVPLFPGLVPQEKPRRKGMR